MKFDNNDHRLKYYELIMELDAEKEIEAYALPEGYSFVTYRDGDKEDWISIEQSAKEFSSYEQGVDGWKRYYAGREDILPGRMFFVLAPNGDKVATATAFFDPKHPDDGKGWLHWVAVRREYQGKGLARPIIAKALMRLRELGHKKLYVPTQTNTWVAAKLYLDFGFRPTAENLKESEFGYRMLKTLTDHPALAKLEALPIEELIASEHQ